MSIEGKISSIVRQYVEAWLQQKQGLSEPPLPKILVLMPNDEYSSEVEEAMRGLSLEYQISYAVNSELLHAGVEWHRLADEAALIAVPMMSLGNLAKTATLVDDEPIPAIVVNALLGRKPVVITTKNLIPTGFEKVVVPANMVDVIEEYLKALQSYGVAVSPFSKLAQTIRDSLSESASEFSYLIHSKHVREWVNEGEIRVKVPSNTKITPLAREDARDFGLKIEVAEEESK